MTTENAKNLRETATEKLYELITDMLEQQHNSNYIEWYVTDDGDVITEEFVDQNSWLQGDHISAIIKLGCGSVGCNCDWCSGDDAVDSVDDIDFDGDEYTTMESQVDEALAEVPVGFFDDEEAE